MNTYTRSRDLFLVPLAERTLVLSFFSLYSHLTPYLARVGGGDGGGDGERSRYT